ncbi:hypothetical protein [Rubrolithibacter danxiaensis]|uniref:hypothetical protein n=1 Tax=Rubrolithibacter danxiaensis TaxID=3390805 RepID=UPI003BF819E8
MASLKDTSQLKNHFKYWTFVLLLTYGLTITIQYLLRPLWFIKSDEHTGLAMFQTMFTILLLPIILVTIVYWLTKKFDKRNWFFLSAIIICSCIYISARLGFLNWADSIGSREHPDNETLMVVAFEWQVGLIVTLIGLTICFVRLYRNKKITV